MTPKRRLVTGAAVLLTVAAALTVTACTSCGVECSATKCASNVLASESTADIAELLGGDACTVTGSEFDAEVFDESGSYR